MTIGSGVRAAARHSPNLCALADLRERRTYRTLLRRMNRYANAVAAVLAPEQGDRVALIGRNSIAWVEALCGIAEAGRIAVPINPGATAREIALILADADVRSIIAEPEAAEKLETEALARAGVSTHVMGDPLEAVLSQASDADPPSLESDRLIFCMPYTSGTTGQPKAVMLSHRSRVQHMLIGMIAAWGVHRAGVRALASSPFFNGGGIVQALAPLMVGGYCRILPRFDPLAALDRIADEKLEVAGFVPTQFQALLNERNAFETADLSSLRALVNGSAALSPSVRAQLTARLGPGRLFDSYGATETGNVSCLKPEDPIRGAGDVGRISPFVEAEIRNVEGEPLPIGQAGEIWVRSPWLFSGYWNRPDETAETLRNGWCSVGDIATLDDQGFLRLVDRRKNTIITGGQNVYPREVEDVLRLHPAVEEAAVVGLPDSYWGEAVVAVVQPRRGATVDFVALKTHCAASLSGYKVPKHFHLWPAIPLGDTGKILHRAVRARLLGQ
jgi:long-chain acyl-CoA synthetase